MSECPEMFQHLNDFLDGELDPSLCAEIERHIGECRNCRLMVDTLRMTIKLCREDGPCEELPAEFSEKLRKILRERWNQKFNKKRP